MCRRTFPYLIALASLAAGGCTDRPAATAPDAFATPSPVSGAPTGPNEELARSFARGLRSPVLRAYLRAKLNASLYREHKVHFQRFLQGDGQHALVTIAAETRAAVGAVAGTAHAAMPLEVYLPVPAHRAAWLGDGRVLVATELRDGDTPVAYDTAGNRYLLDPDTPPAIPVLALVPVETDFSIRPGAMMCYERCGGGGGGGGSYGPAAASTPGLYMTQAHFTQTFESWLKGSPEFEVHILGQKGQSDSLTDYQCAGELQPAPYSFDQNDVDWSGSVMLFSQTQLDTYKSTHAGQGVRVFFVEDDDTACQIKVSNDRFSKALAAVDSLTKMRAAGKDTTSSIGGSFISVPSLSRFYNAVASLINTNDDLAGNAVADSVAGEQHAGANWIVKGENNVTNGWINLEMR